MKSRIFAMGQKAWVNSTLLKEWPDNILRFGMRILLALVALFIGIQIVKLIQKIVRKSMSKANVEKGVIQFTDSFLKVTLYVILFFMIAQNFGLDAASVMALVGSAGVAIGLAIQGSLSNFAGGVLILLLHPFRIGDYIQDAAGNEGTVQEIQLFYTRLSTPDNKIIVIPNGTLANNSLTNVTGLDRRRLDLCIGISYDSDIRQAKEAILKVLTQDAKVLRQEEMRVYVDALGESAVNLGVRCYFLNEDYWEGKWRITEAVKYALDEAGITIPFPQVEIHYASGEKS